MMTAKVWFKQWHERMSGRSGKLIIMLYNRGSRLLVGRQLLLLVRLVELMLWEPVFGLLRKSW
jgi:hypothetical protein